MTCVIQQAETKLFLTEQGDWTSDFNGALEFQTVRETLRYKTSLHLDDAAVLIFDERHVHRLDESMMPLA